MRGEEHVGQEHRTMYEDFFHFEHRPFASVPQVASYFPAAASEAARESLARCVQRAEGPALLIGPPGTGKSLLCHLLIEQFSETLEVAYLAGAHLATRRALLQAILFELKRPYRGLDEGELRLALIDHLAPCEANPHGLLLIVDEAQTLPLRLLEELRLITNLVRQGQPRVRLVLAGGHELEERFASPQLDAFSQRIAARCYLQAFQRAETADYVAAQIRACGGRPDGVFTREAIDAVHDATDGVPRLINQLCDHALILAYAAGLPRIDRDGVEEAWADLQQLPTPWNAANSNRGFGVVTDQDQDSVIEFGGLDDDDADDAEPVSVPIQSARDEAPYSDALDRLDDLSEQVDSIDEEFEPAGSIQPEVEFMLPEVLTDSVSTFDEEEVIIDRYAELDARCWGHRPQVASREGSELSAMLTRFLQNEPADPLRLVDELQSAIINEGDVTSATSMVGAEAVDPTTCEEVAAPAAEVVAQASTETPEGFAEASVDTSQLDEDLIVIEEDEPEELVTLRRQPAVKRQEYRQLFARLRSG